MYCHRPASFAGLAARAQSRWIFAACSLDASHSCSAIAVAFMLILVFGWGFWRLARLETTPHHKEFPSACLRVSSCTYKQGWLRLWG